MLLFFAVCFSLFLRQQSSLAHTVSMSALKISKWQSSHCSKIFSGLSSSPSNVIFTLCPMCFCRAFHKSISRSIILYHSVKRQPFFFAQHPVCIADFYGLLSVISNFFFVCIQTKKTSRKMPFSFEQCIALLCYFRFSTNLRLA